MWLGVLVFLSCALAASGLYLWFAPDRTQQRVQALQGHRGLPSGWQTSWVKVAGPLARLSVPTGNWERSPLRLRFLQAGIRSERARLFYFGAKTLLPLLLGAVAYVALAQGSRPWMQLLLWASTAALLGTYLPNLLLFLRARNRQREVFESFPDASDLMLLCMEAGLGLDASLTRVAEEIRSRSAVLGEEMHLVQLEMQAGAPRDQALQHLALRTGVEEVASFALMLRQAERFGASIGDSLRVYAEELRHKRMVRAEAQAARIPTQLLLPLVLCIFPALLMVVLGPAAIRILRQMMPMLGGAG